MTDFLKNIISLSVSAFNRPNVSAMLKLMLLAGFSGLLLPVNIIAQTTCKGVLLGYKYEKVITINDNLVEGSNIDFPVLINISNDTLRNVSSGGNVFSISGYDIIFTDLSYNKLDHDLDTYDPVTGNVVSWVKVPSLSKGTTTQIRMLYGNPSIIVSQSSKTTWDSNFEGVWHLNADCLDATSNSNNGNNVNTSPATGKISTGAYFNHQNDKIVVSSASWSLDASTVEVWFNTAEIADVGAHYIFGHGTTGNTNLIQLYLEDNQTLVIGLGAQHVLYNLMTVNKGEWYHVVLKWSGNGTPSQNVDVLVNGISRVAISPPFYSLLSTNIFADIGNNVLTGTEGLLGFIDEFRVSKVARSNDWIQTEYNNQVDPPGFISVGKQVKYIDPVITGPAEVSPGAAGVVYTTVDPFVLGHTYSWSTNAALIGPNKNKATVTWSTDCSSQGWIYVTETDPGLACQVKSAIFDVIFTDATLPEITPGTNVFQTADPGICGAMITVPVATATDNCSVGSPTGTRSDGYALNALYPLGTTTITWTVSDGYGNQAVPKTQTVSVTDDEKPVITTGGNITKTADPGVCNASINVAPATVTDNCSVGAPVGNRNDGLALGDPYPVGTTIITWTFTDENGNAALPKIQTVTVTDNEKPVINAGGNITQTADPGICGAVVSVAAATASDNCTVGTATGTRSDALDLSAAYPVGTTTIIWTFTDASGNTALSKNQTVTVTDNEKPVIIAGGNITQTTDPGVCSAVVTIVAASATDNCSVGEPTGTRSDGLLVTETFPTGTTVITWRGTDVNGNMALEKTQTVTVTDNEKPIITTGGDITQTADPGVCGASIIVVAATVTDNCTFGATTGTRSDALPLNDVYPVGTTIIIWTFTDASGNVALPKNQTVTVTDNETPVITAGANINKSSDPGVCGAFVTVTAAIVSDKCHFSLATGTRSDGLQLTEIYPIGITDITWTFTDPSGNAALPKIQTVTITDNEQPVINTGADITQTADPGICGAVVSVAAATASDNCPIGTPTSTRSDALSLSDAYPVGTTTITWSITDANGNTATEKTQSVTVTDNEKPVISSGGNITQTSDPGVCGAAVAIVAASATDNCSVVAPTGTRSDGRSLTEAFPLGTTIITWRVTDVNGNIALEKTQTVTVTDNEKPVITSGVDITQTADPGVCGAKVTVAAATATDNCSVNTPIGTRSDGLDLNDAYPVGNTTIIWRVSDINGNVAQDKAQLITVTDNEKPIISVGGDLAQSCDPGVCGATITIAAATATDNCSVGTPSGTRSDGLALTESYPVGTTMIIWRVTDINGNIALEKTQTVTVTDNEKPVITAGSNIEQTADPGACGASVFITHASATDNCSVGPPIGTRSDALTLSDSFPVGTTTITWSTTDTNGNLAVEIIQTVIVTDDESPMITAGSNIIQTADQGVCGASVNVAPATALDNCSAGTPTGTRSDGLPLTNSYPVGTTTIAWNFTDGRGNAALEKSQTVTITDDEKPAIISPPDATGTTNSGCASTNVALGTPITTDNCFVSSVTNDAPASFQLGNTTVTWTVTDASGNSSTSTQLVTVFDNILPEFTPPADITVCRLNDCTYDISLLVTGDVTNESDNCSTGIEATYSDQLSGPDDCNRDIFIDRKWKLTDNSGNVKEKVQIIRIKPLATASIANSTPVICNGSNAVLLFESPTESSITSELKYQVIITSTDPAHLSGGASVGFPLTKPQMPFHLNADLTNSSNAPIEVTYALVSGVSGCLTTTIVSTTVIVNPSGSLLPLSGEIVCNGSSTTEVPFMTLNTGGTSSYNWVNDLPSIGLSSNGSGDRIVAFTGVNNVDKFVTANISVTPFFTFAGLTCEGQMKSFTITVNPTPRVVPVNPDLKPDTSICYGTATAITLNSPTEMTSGSILFDFTTTASDVSVTGDLSSGVNINPGYVISRSYQNKSNKIQSVYYSITPRNDLNVCSPGKTVISEVKVHPKVINYDYLVPGGDGVEIVQPLTCEGGSNASLKVHTSTDAGPYYFSWDRSSTMKLEGFGLSFVDNLIGGGWQVTVTDALGCKNSSFKDIAGGAAFNTYFNAYKNVTCPGGNDGELAIQENGTGNSPYLYEIHRIYNGKDVIVINDTIETKGIYHYHYDQLPGIYRLFMKDNSGCSNVNYLHPDPPEEIIAEPDSIKAQFMTINETCKGADGTIDIISVTGGSGGFSYSWFYDSLRLNPINITDPQHLKGLVSGNYYLDIKDIKNCIQPETVTVDPPVPLVFTAVPREYNGVNISCYGLSDGAIEIVPVTGTGPYRYFLKRPDGTELESASPVFSNLSAGKYLTSVIDNNFCMDSVAVELIEPGKLGLELRLSESKAGGFNINCTGQKSGTIDINALNAVKVPVFIWSDGFLGESRKDLPAGSYSVVVVDANNCRAAADTVLTEPTPLSLSFEDVRQPFCPDKPDGSITVNGLGGVKGIDYSYKWSDNSIQSILAGVSAGEYTVLITDMNGCTISGSQKIEALNKTCLVIPNAISPNGDTFNDVWNIGEILLYPQAEVKVFNRLGQIVWRSEKGYPSPWDGTSNGTPLPFDSYHYIIDLHNNSKPFIGSITIIK